MAWCIEEKCLVWCVVFELTNAEGSDRAQTRHDDATHGIGGDSWVLVIGWIGYDSSVGGDGDADASRPSTTGLRTGYEE